MAAARSDRDRHLETLRETPDPQGFSCLESAITEADRLAAAALFDSERVSSHAQLRLRRREVAEALPAMRKTASGAGVGLSEAAQGHEGGVRTARTVAAPRTEKERTHRRTVGLHV